MFAVLMVLLLIFLGRFFSIFLAEAASGEIPGSTVLDIMLLRTLASLNQIIPISLFIAVLLAFGRLYKDNEMTALFASGISIAQICRATAGLFTAIAGLVLLVTLFVAPWAYEEVQQIRDRVGSNSGLSGLAAGEFRHLGGDIHSVFYVEKLSDDRSKLENIFIQMQHGEQNDVFSAKSGYIKIDERNGDRFLVLSEGYRYQGVPGSREFNIQAYKESAIRIEQQSVEAARRKQRAIPTLQLWQSNSVRDAAELQWRVCMPISTFLLAILAILISRTSPRQGRFSKVFSAILIFIIYNNVSNVARSWVERGTVSQEIGIWWVPSILFVVVAIMFLKQIGWPALLNRRRVLSE